MSTAGLYEWRIGYCNGSYLQPVFWEREWMLWIMMPFFMSGGAEGGCRLWVRSKSNTSGWLTLARLRLFRFHRQPSAVWESYNYSACGLESLTLPLHSHVCFAHRSFYTEIHCQHASTLHAYIQIPENTLMSVWLIKVEHKIRTADIKFTMDALIYILLICTCIQFLFDTWQYCIRYILLDITFLFIVWLLYNNIMIERDG